MTDALAAFDAAEVALVTRVNNYAVLGTAGSKASYAA
jgi:hypothetical protein